MSSPFDTDHAGFRENHITLRNKSVRIDVAARDGILGDADGRTEDAILLPSWMVLVSLAGSAPAAAQPPEAAVRVDLPSAPLATSLLMLAQRHGIELLFDSRALSTSRSPAIHARMPLTQALTRLLAGSGFVARQIGPGRFVVSLIKPDAVLPAPQVAAAAIPDILVIGHRSLNLDIPRTRDDIQPYRVISSDEVPRSPGQSVDDLLRTRLSADVQSVAARQQPGLQLGSVRSEVDLRGLGPVHTLVLVDGRRLPSVAATNDFLQPDLNAIPLSAIDRIETLGGTAGAIYGPGATGGVVNVVLRHDTPGAWLQASSGINARGDGSRRQIEGGLAWADASTRADLIVGLGADDGLVFGDRAFVTAARNLRVARGDSVLPPTAAAVNVSSIGGQLMLRPDLGGGSLGSTYATYPINGGGNGADEAALLRSGAGRYTLGLSPDGSGTQQTLLTPYRTISALGSIRREMGAVELFFDGLVLQDQGFATGPRILTRQLLLSAGQAGNPFTTDVYVSYDTPGLSAVATTRTTTTRGTGGIIVHLGPKWSIEGEASLAGSQVVERTPIVVSLPGVDVFTPGMALANAISAYTTAPDAVAHRTNDLRDVSLRIAGPLARLGGGPLSLEISAEDRLERNPGETSLQPDGSYQPAFVAGLQRVGVSSVFGELRAPLVSAASPLKMLRGLELQLAGRLDRYRIVEPDELAFGGTTATVGVARRYLTFAYTVGAKATPVEGVTLRASYADASLPASLVARQILPLPLPFPFQPYADPERPGQPVLATAPVLLVLGGSSALGAERARTVSAGVVLRPAALPDLRLSIDYTHLTKSHEAAAFPFDGAYVLAHKSLFPGRVVRNALTPGDAALGYTGGVVTRIDLTSLDTASTTLDVVDVDFQFVRATPLGRFGAKLGASFEPNYQRRMQPSVVEQLAGYDDGPIRWKGNAGLTWDKGPFGLLIETQFVDRYRVIDGADPASGAISTSTLQQQQALFIPAQAYVDLGVHYGPLPVGRRAQLTYRLRVSNILDHLPPLVIPAINGGSDGLGYSPYGDPRGRRFEISARVGF